jgi:hypothetical protein
VTFLGPSQALAPPGHYLLFVIVKDGAKRVPSKGLIVKF